MAGTSRHCHSEERQRRGIWGGDQSLDEIICATSALICGQYTVPHLCLSVAKDSNMKSSANNLRLSAADIKAIAFDGYGTLFDFTEPDFIAAFAEICALQGLDAE